MIFDLGRLMIAHVSIGVGNVDTSKRFYDAALEPLEYKTCGPRDSYWTTRPRA
jgi:hypothetical protein